MTLCRCAGTWHLRRLHSPYFTMLPLHEHKTTRLPSDASGGINCTSFAKRCKRVPKLKWEVRRGTRTHTPWHGDLLTFLYFLLLIEDFTDNSWWHNELYLEVYSKFAPYREHSLSPWKWWTTWRISKHYARSENHRKTINRPRGQNPGIFYIRTRESTAEQ